MKTKKGLALMLAASISLSLLGGMATNVGATTMNNGALSWDFETENDFANMCNEYFVQGTKVIVEDTFNTGGWSRVDATKTIVNNNANSPYSMSYVTGSPHRIKYSMIGGATNDLTSRTKDTNTFAYNDNSCQSTQEDGKTKNANRTPVSVKTSGDEDNNNCAVVIANSRWNTEHEGQYYILGMNIQLTDEQLIPGREYELTADVLSSCRKVNFADRAKGTLLEGTDDVYYTNLQRYVWAGVGKPSKRSEEFASTLAVKPGWALNKEGYGTGKVVDTNLSDGKTSGTQWSTIKTTIKADEDLYENGAVALYIGISPHDEETLENAKASALERCEKVYFDNIKLTPVEKSNGIITNEAKLGKHWTFEDAGSSWNEFPVGSDAADWKALKEITNENNAYKTAIWNDVPHAMFVEKKETSTSYSSQYWTAASTNPGGYGISYGTPARGTDRCLVVGPSVESTITGIRYVMNSDEWMPGDYTLKLYGANSNKMNAELHVAFFKGDVQLECRNKGGSTFEENLAQHNAIVAQFDSSNTKLLADYKLGGLQKSWGYYTKNITVNNSWFAEDKITMVIYARTNNWDTVPTDAANMQLMYSFVKSWNEMLYLDEISMIYDTSTALDSVTTANVYQRTVSDKSLSNVHSYLAVYDDDNDSMLVGIDKAGYTVVNGVSHRNMKLTIDENVGWPLWKLFTWDSNLKPYNSALESE